MNRIPEFYPQPDHARLSELFADPPREYGAIAFWFLNDHLQPEELSRQLREFARAGFAAVCPCARIGLSAEIGYLTTAWFDLMKHVVRECATLGLRVVLYDEASYPSGSANGLVVERNPAFAARGLTAITQTVTLPGPRFVRLSAGRCLDNRPLALIAGRVVDTKAQTDTLRRIELDARGIARLDLEPGQWELALLVDCPTGGRIRGAHAWQDDESALAPPAADLLNPDSVAAFIELTHEQYFAHLGQWFGSTIVAMFTDEPSLGGRGARSDALPWTDGLLNEIAELRGETPEETLVALGSLFLNVDSDTGIASAHRVSVSRRLARVYYDAQRSWCEEHQIALTGHPSAADELDLQHHFTWPGQDTVWRWVLPGPTALQGPESAAPRTASSVAAQRGISTVFGEIFGAYGWRLSLDEAKWLLDWHLVRGTTAFLLHALFYSIRENRAYESEPDLGLHHPWWPLFPQLLTYLRRQVLLLRAWPEEPSLLVITDADADAAADLYQRGITFHYTSPQHCPVATASGYALGAQHYPALAATPGAKGTVPDASELASLDQTDFPVAAPGLRVSRRVASAWFVVNETDEPIRLPMPGWTAWDAWTGRREAMTETTLLNRRQALFLTPGSTPAQPEPAFTKPLPLSSWRVISEPASPDSIGDWAQLPGLETWSGALSYEATFDSPASQPLCLNLGVVGEAATVWLNDSLVSQLFWPPYETTLPAAHVLPGTNRLRVRVINSAANHFEGAQRPSGLIGPVTLFGA